MACFGDREYSGGVDTWPRSPELGAIRSVRHRERYYVTPVDNRVKVIVGTGGRRSAPSERPSLDEKPLVILIEYRSTCLRELVRPLPVKSENEPRRY